MEFIKRDNDLSILQIHREITNNHGFKDDYCRLKAKAKTALKTNVNRWGNP